ncbi:MAG TPA: endospore germination permease [Firmicutes bacterium]|jgi:spore germination protein KB|nr:endospore germination permease [Bacillota bacterium]
MRGKISNWQLGALLSFTVLSTGLFLMGHMVEKFAGRDSWLMPFTLFVFINAAGLLWATLARRFSTLTLVQYCPLILGKPLGYIVNFLYLWFFVFVLATVTREFVEVINLFLPMVSPSLLGGTMLALCIYAAWLGLEVIARSGVHVIVLLVAITLVHFFSIIPQADWSALQPVLANGLSPVLKSSWYAFAFAGEMVIVLMLFPQLAGQATVSRAFLGASVLICILALFFTVISTTILGPIVARLYFPYLMLARLAPMRIDVLIFISWVSGLFIKLAFLLYVSNLALVQVFQLRDANRTLLPLAFLGAVLSIVLYPTGLGVYDFVANVWPAYGLTMEVLLPLALLLVAVVRRVSRQEEGKG